MTAQARGVRTRSTATLLAGAAVLVTATAGATWMLSRPRDNVASSAEVVTRFTIEGKST